MKKMFLSAALALAVAGSWAFYPKAQSTPHTVAITGRLLFPEAAQASAFLIKIDSDGKVTETELEAKRSPIKKLSESLDKLHKAELIEVNKLQAAGYTLTATNSTVLTERVLETTYYLTSK